MLAGFHSWKTEMAFPLMTNFLVLGFDCTVEFAMGEIILEHVDHVVEVNEEVTDGNNVHFAKC